MAGTTASPAPDRGPVIAISGAIGAGKGALAAAIAGVTGRAVAAFGDEVRREVAALGRDPGDPDELQRVGQALVLDDLQGLVRRTLSSAGPDVVVSGVRHWEVLDELRRQLAPRPVALVHLETSRARREARLRACGAVPRQVAARDDHLNEAQVARVLPQYAAITVDGDLPVDLQVARLRTFGFLPGTRQ